MMEMGTGVLMKIMSPTSVAGVHVLNGRPT
ncbi:hypothetical protein GECvBMG_gp265 [Salmonella phage GEC_vB_MG]|nr:hypothetical protein GECvBMG_gp265 [Salmonella phage GEC_vB_MG]